MFIESFKIGANITFLSFSVCRKWTVTTLWTTSTFLYGMTLLYQNNSSTGKIQEIHPQTRYMLRMTVYSKTTVIRISCRQKCGVFRTYISLTNFEFINNNNKSRSLPDPGLFYFIRFKQVSMYLLKLYILIKILLERWIFPFLRRYFIYDFRHLR